MENLLYLKLFYSSFKKYLIKSIIIEDILLKIVNLNLKIFLNINLTYIHCKFLAVYLFTDPTRANSFHFASHGKSFLFKIYFTHVSLKIKYHTDNIM